MAYKIQVQDDENDASVWHDVKDASGKTVNWAIEMNSPGVLAQAGWSKRTFKTGDQITISVRPAKAGTHAGAPPN